MSEKLPKNRTGFGRLISASAFSWCGLRDTYQTEEGFRQECWAGLVLIPLSFFIAQSAVEWVLLVITYLGVLMVETLNTAVEVAVERHSTDIHPLTKKAKDAGSAAVGIAIIIAVLTWMTIAIY